MRYTLALSLALLIQATSHAHNLPFNAHHHDFSVSADLSPDDNAVPIDSNPLNSTAGFDIQIVYATGTTPTASQAAAFSAAEAAWESRIIGYTDTVANNVLTINVTLENIDGAGGILGSAGPSTAKFGAEGNFLYSASGTMRFDTSDTDNLELNGTFGSVIEHEMAHVIGLGTLWSSSAVGFAGFQEVYADGSGQYTGASALAQWQTEFGQTGATFVPIELGGGPGTANGHWDEVDGGAGLTGITQAGTGNDLRNEIMTGWLNSPAFVSDLTIASFEDIGYEVVLNNTAVPEPSSILLSLAGISFLILRRKR